MGREGSLEDPNQPITGSGGWSGSRSCVFVPTFSFSTIGKNRNLRRQTWGGCPFENAIKTKVTDEIISFFVWHHPLGHAYAIPIFKFLRQLLHSWAANFSAEPRNLHSINCVCSATIFFMEMVSDVLRKLKIVFYLSCTFRWKTWCYSVHVSKPHSLLRSRQRLYCVLFV